MLFGFGHSLPEKLIDAVLEFRRHNVIPDYTQREMNAHMFWYANEVMMGRLLVALIVGCIVAIVAKAREMVATLTLSFVLFALSVVVWFNVAKHWPDGALPLPMIFTDFAGIALIPMTGVMVRKVRRAVGRWQSSV